MGPNGGKGQRASTYATHKRSAFVSRNRATLFQIGRAAKQIIKTYPTSLAATQAQEILDKYSLK